MTLGSTLQRLRKERGWTQGKLAAYSGMSQSHLSKIERSEFYGHKGRLEAELAALQSDLTALDEQQIDPEQITQALDALLALTDGEHADPWRDQNNVPAVKAALRQAGVRITVADAHADIALNLA